MAEIRPETRRALAIAIAVLAVALNAVVSLPEAWRARPFGIVVGPRDDDLRLQDFTSHLRMARLALRLPEGGERAASIYSVEAHREMTSDWAGRPAPAALPFGYSPTMVWVLAPLTAFDDPIAYLLWSLAGLGILGWLLWPREDRPVVAGLIFVSPLALAAFTLGQTAVYSNAVLLLLALPDVSPGARGRGRPVADALLLWLLTAKPPVALMAGAALLGVGRWRGVALAVGLTLLTTAVIHPRLGPGWVADYLSMARHYNSEEAAPLFAWCLSPTYMSNLRAGLWAIGFSDATASRLASIALAAVTALVCLAGLSRRLTPWAVWGLGLLAFLLLAPHVNVTEELHLYAAAVVGFLALRGSAGAAERSLPALCVACCWAGALMRSGSAWLWPALTAKVILAGVILCLGTARHRAAVAESRRA